MLSSLQKKSVDRLIEETGIVHQDEADDTEANEANAAKLLQKILIDFNSLDAALYAFFHKKVNGAFGGIEFYVGDDEMGDDLAFFTDSFKSRDTAGRAKVGFFLLELALAEEDGERRGRCLWSAQRVFGAVEVAEDSPAGALKWLLDLGFDNFRSDEPIRLKHIVHAAEMFVEKCA